MNIWDLARGNAEIQTTLEVLRLRAAHNLKYIARPATDPGLENEVAALRSTVDQLRRHVSRQENRATGSGTAMSQLARWLGFSGAPSAAPESSATIDELRRDVTHLTEELNELRSRPYDRGFPTSSPMIEVPSNGRMEDLRAEVGHLAEQLRKLQARSSERDFPTTIRWAEARSKDYPDDLRAEVGRIVEARLGAVQKELSDRLRRQLAEHDVQTARSKDMDGEASDLRKLTEETAQLRSKIETIRAQVEERNDGSEDLRAEMSSLGATLDATLLLVGSWVSKSRVVSSLGLNPATQQPLSDLEQFASRQTDRLQRSYRWQVTMAVGVYLALGSMLAWSAVMFTMGLMEYAAALGTTGVGGMILLRLKWQPFDRAGDARRGADEADVLALGLRRRLVTIAEISNPKKRQEMEWIAVQEYLSESRAGAKAETLSPNKIAQPASR